jgi:GDP-4-dehydro-6-deoxy-D-mannose reductase
VKVLVTGAGGFAGRWLTAELEAGGHEAIAAPSQRDVDLATSPDLAPVIREVAPDAVAHLAGMAFAPDAKRDPEAALRVNAGGTTILLESMDRAGSLAAALVVSSGDVYGRPEQLPLREDMPTRASDPYGKSKVAQERAALAAHGRGRRLVIVRAFNHIGPGQRPTFAAPAIARRVLALKRGQASDIPIGNVDVRRDFTDVRDVVRAYRLLLEALAREELPVRPPVVNVGSGRSVPVRDLIAILCGIADVPMRIRRDPEFVRPNEPAEIRADISRVRELVGWRPQIPLEKSLADLLASIEAEGA